METINENKHSKLVEILLKAYAAKVEANPSFSMRAFSKKLEVSSGALSEILQNKRRMTSLTAKKLLKNLFYSPAEIEHFLEDEKNDNTTDSDREYKDLTLDQYAVISDWRYLAFLNLIELPHEEHSFLNLSTRLDLTPKKIQEIAERLLKLEMIKKEDGRFIRTFIRYKTTEDMSNMAIRKYHHDTIDLASDALREVEVELRDFSSVLLKVNPKNLKKVKELIRKFQDEVCDLVENDFPEEIYHMNVHLYPVTKKNESGRKK